MTMTLRVLIGLFFGSLVGAADGPSLSSLTAAPGWISEPQGTVRLEARLDNPGAAKTCDARWELVGKDGKVLARTTTAVAVPTGGASTSWTIKTDGLPIGIHDARVSLFMQGDEGTRLGGEAQDLAIAGPDDLVAVFAEQPNVRGVDIDRSGMRSERITTDGFRRWCWRANQSFGGDGWWHALRLTTTDPRFAKGARPVVDVAVTYRHLPDAPVNLMGNTLTGPRQFAEGWGRNEGWQTMFTQVDDAEWNKPQLGADPKRMLADGVDLRFNACTEDATLRSILIRGYDLEQPDWRRLLRYDGLDVGRPRFVFAPGEKQDIHVKLRNLAKRPCTVDAVVRLVDDLEKPIWERTEQRTLAANSATAMPVSLDTAGLKQGVYTLTIDLRLPKSTDTLLACRANLMVSEDSPIAKARPGEFLYGLDSGVSISQAGWADWFGFMGVDILRNIDSSSMEAVDREMALVKKYGLQTGMILGVPHDQDPAARAKRTTDMAAFLGTVAARYRDDLHFYELGNEPDLPFFYNGPIADYITTYQALRAAVKAADPTAMVMNGGLCFAGDDGFRRAHEFLATVPADELDGVALHAHGPGWQSEARIVELVRNALKARNLTRPLVDTETGLAAHTPVQQRLQARTCVQKMVYAQEQGLLTMYWFRLFISGGDADYTNSIDVAQPRPVILAYRTMVKTLRHQRFVKRLDLGRSEWHAYVFADEKGSGRTLVSWADANGGARRLVALGGDVNNLQRRDLFGNETALAAGTFPSITIDEDPSYVSWDGGDAQAVLAIESPITVPRVTWLQPDAAGLVSVTVHNPGSDKLSATLNAVSGAGNPVRPTGSTAVELAAGAKATLTIPVQVGRAPATVAWPKQWTCFLRVPAGTIDPATLRSIPATLNVGGKPLTGVQVPLIDGKLDLAKAAHGFGEKLEALCFAEVTVPAACTVTMGASADYWMGWWVGGKPVYDTFANGNGSGYRITDHRFPITLAAGRNLLVVRALSGSQGWCLMSGGPAELAAVDGAGSDRLAIELRHGTDVLAADSLVIRLLTQPGSTPAWDAPAAAWSSVATDGTLGDAGVVNLFAKQPEATRWWKGADDLSGRCWMRADAKRLWLTVAVNDDLHRIGSDPDASDAIRLSLSGTGAPLTVAVIGDGTVLRLRDGRWSPEKATAGAVTATVQRDARSAVTWYRIAIDRSLLPGKTIAWNLRLIDDDFGGLKQYVDLIDEVTGGSEAWPHAALP